MQDKEVSVRLPSALVLWLDTYAKLKSKNRSQVIREILADKCHSGTIDFQG